MNTRMDVFRLQPGLAKPVEQVLEAQPAVDEDAQRRDSCGFDHGGIARTATAQAFEPQHGRGNSLSGQSGQGKPDLFQVVGDHLHDALGIGR
jgi:hypothetical protein